MAHMGIDLLDELEIEISKLILYIGLFKINLKIKTFV